MLFVFLVEFLWSRAAKWQVVEWCGFFAVASAARFDGSSPAPIWFLSPQEVPGVQMSRCHYSSYLLLEMPFIQIPDSFLQMLIVCAVIENSFAGAGLL